MISPVKRPTSKYPVIDRNDHEKYYVYTEEELPDGSKELFHRAVHVFVETFGGGLVLQRFRNRITLGAFGHMIAYEPKKSAASRIVKLSLGVEPRPEEFEEVATVSPCQESEGEIIYAYNVLIDLNEDKIRPGENLEEIIISPLDVIVDDVLKNRSSYSPMFVILLNMFLELYKS